MPATPLILETQNDWRDGTFFNCRDVGFKVCKVQIELFYNDVYHREHCISRVSLLIYENTYILGLSRIKRQLLVVNLRATVLW